MANVQSKTYEAVGASTTHAVAFDSPVADGNSIVVAVRITDGAGFDITTRITSITCADNLNGSHGQIESTVTPDDDKTNMGAMFYKSDVAAGTTTVTVTTNISTTVYIVMVEEDDILTLEDSAINIVGDNVTAHTSGSVTTTGTNRRIFSMIVSDADMSTIVPATGETERGEVVGRLQLQDEDAATATSYTHSWTIGVTADVSSIIAAFSVSSGASQELFGASIF